MNQGLFADQVNRIEKLLNDLKLLVDRNQNPSYSKYGASDFRHLRYFDIWKLCKDNKIYDFLLQDGSLLQFRANSFRPSLDVSYVYYECPEMPKEPFEKFFKQAKRKRGEDIDEYELFDEYEQRLLEQKETVTPLRYDYSPKLYVPGQHPASHLHFGYENNLRVGTRKILRPLSFTLFIIRQCYPDQWDKLKADQQETELLCREVKTALDKVPEESFREVVDAWEMYLE